MLRMFKIRFGFRLFVVMVFSEVFLINFATTEKPIAGIFEAFGYSPSCVAAALTSCEGKAKLSNEKSVTDSLETIISLLQEIRPEKKRPKNCAEIKDLDDCTSGVQTVYPYGCPRRPIKVLCDQSTEGGGWTLFQNRDNLTIREDFFRDWQDYASGFGNLTGEFWLGLDNIHALLSSNQMELRIDLENYEGVKVWAKYKTFRIGDVTSKYILTIGGYSGDAGDGFGGGRHNGRKFSTKDQDNDEAPSSCAQAYKGGWWYDNCHISNLNGFQYVGKHPSYADGINWHPWLGYNYSLRKSRMMIRPV